MVHGRDDPLVPLTGGIDTRDNIPGAELLVIDGMGHDLPRGAWQTIADGISGFNIQGVMNYTPHIASLAAGFLIPMSVVLVTGVREPWDHNGYFFCSDTGDVCCCCSHRCQIQDQNVALADAHGYRPGSCHADRWRFMEPVANCRGCYAGFCPAAVPDLAGCGFYRETGGKGLADSVEASDLKLPGQL